MRTSVQSHSPQARTRATVRGEVVHDTFRASSDRADVLPAAVLQHWGLIASPFSPKRGVEQPFRPTDFYFRTAAHASACSWLQKLVCGPASLVRLTAPSEFGATTWLRQILATAGLGNTAIHAAATTWSGQPLEQLTAALRDAVGEVHTPGRVRTLWLICTPDFKSSQPRLRNPLAMLNDWWAAQRNRLHNLNIILLTRESGPVFRDQSTGIARSRGLHPAFDAPHFARASCQELQRCICTAMHHAGAIRKPFTKSAETVLAEACEGSIARLAYLVHTSLVQGHAAGIEQINQANLRQWFAMTDHRSNRPATRAA